METLLRGLLSGFIIGIVCVVYVLIRSWRLEARLPASEVKSMESEFVGNSWMIMAFASSASILWGFLGAAAFRLLRNKAEFMGIFIFLGIALAGLFYFRDVQYKLDKIILTLIITFGLAVLIPAII